MVNDDGLCRMSHGSGLDEYELGSKSMNFYRQGNRLQVLYVWDDVKFYRQ